MGMVMRTPGVYEGDYNTNQDDFTRWRTLVANSRLEEIADSQKMRLHSFNMVKGREEAFQTVCDLVNDKIECPIILFYGEPGRSKTHLTVAAAWCFLAKLRSVFFYEVVDLLDAMREGIRIERELAPGEFNRNAFRILKQRLERVNLLIIDDIGLESPTDFAGEQLEHLVDFRYVKHLPTLLTANTVDGFERILDRCRQGRVVGITGESYREVIMRENKAKQAKTKKGV